MAQGPTPKSTPAAIGPAGPSQLETLRPNPPPYEAATQVEAGHEVVDRRDYRSRVNSRFFGAWFWGVVVWVLLSGLFRSYYEVLWPRHRHRVHQSGENFDWSDYSIPHNITIGPCQQWQVMKSYDESLPFVGETHLDLPIDSESLFLFSRGPLAEGTLHITTDNKVPSGRVYVNVTMHTFAHWLQYSSKVCSTSRMTGQNGVGIFSHPKGILALPAQKLIMFETTLSFPSGPSRTVNNLDIDMPNFTQNIGNLSDYLFNRFAIQTSNAPIEAEALRVNNGIIETSWAPIKGVFNTSSSLTLKTTMSPISVDIGASSDGNTTHVMLSTSAFPLRANVSLLADSLRSDCDFEVSASTSYGSMDITFPTQPLASALRFLGFTSDAPASVSLDPAYEGKISLNTSNSRSSYVLRETTIDPAGHRRHRLVDLELNGGILSGDVAWVDHRHHPKGQGQIALYTTNSDAALVL